MKIIEKRKNGTTRVYTKNTLPSKTDPSFKDEVDVNNIVKKYEQTRQLQHLNRYQGSYQDLTQIPDLLTSMTQVTQAQSGFNHLPSQLRSRFGNSPVEFLKFLSDDANREEAQSLGLIPKTQAPTPDPVLTELQTISKNTTKKAPKVSNDDD